MICKNNGKLFTQVFLTVCCAIFLVIVTFPLTGFAQTDPGLLKREAILDDIFRKNAKEFGLPTELVKAISRQESDCHPLMVNINGKDYKPKTVDEAVRLCEMAKKSGMQYDAGIMQINRYWIKKYAIPHRLLFSPSDNIYMGCYILAQEIKRGGMNWKSIGRYHSRTPSRREAYSSKIKKHLLNILAESDKN